MLPHSIIKAKSSLLVLFYDNGGEGWLFDVGCFLYPGAQVLAFFFLFFFETLNFLEGEAAVYIYHTPFKFILSVT